MKVVMVDPRQLRPYAKNPRKNDAAVEGVAKSIQAFGFKQPIVCDEDFVVIVGHTRLKAALHLGMDKVPVLVAHDLTPEKARAYRLADNRTAEAAEWDLPKLDDELSALAELDFDMMPFGFDLPEAIDAPGDVDAAAEAPEAAPEAKLVKKGDVIELGENKLVCGDCTTPESYAPLASHYDLCLTDLPYGADIDYDGYDDTEDALKALIAGFLPRVRELCDVVALTPGIKNVWLYPPATWMLGWFYGAGTGRLRYGFSTWQPFIVYGADPKLKAGEGSWPDGYATQAQGNSFELKREGLHVVPKPLSVWQKFLGRLTNKHTRRILDPFAGSGTTLIAAAEAGLNADLIEQSPVYCEVIVERWLAYKHSDTVTINGEKVRWPSE